MMLGKPVTAQVQRRRGGEVSGYPFFLKVRAYMLDRIWTARLVRIMMLDKVVREVGG